MVEGLSQDVGSHGRLARMVSRMQALRSVPIRWCSLTYM